MSRCRNLLLGLALFPAGVYATDAAAPLHINPFVQPQVVADADTVVVSAAADTMVLRGVMLAGEHSLANISGQILGIGQEINGYRLIAVNEDNVVLDREGVRRELGVTKQDGMDNNEQVTRRR
jgi:type II secretory pathway component PulC